MYYLTNFPLKKKISHIWHVMLLLNRHNMMSKLFQMQITSETNIPKSVEPDNTKEIVINIPNDINRFRS